MEQFTLSDFLKLPEGAPYQLIDGSLLMNPSPTTRHQRIVGKIFRLLADWSEKNDQGEAFLAPFDVVLDESNVVQPDIVYVAKERLPIVQDRCMGIPDLVVEILSPSNAGYDRTRKQRIYARFQVPRLWIVDPEEQTFECLTLDGATYRIESSWTGDDVATPPVFPGLEISLLRFW